MSQFNWLLLGLLAAALSLDSLAVAADRSPFHVGTVDFISGAHDGQCGCPTVMNKNRKEQMVLVITTDASEALGKLLQGIQDKTVDGGSVKGHVVFLAAKNHRSKTEQEAIAAELREFTMTHATDRFTFGIRRASKSQFYIARKIDPAIAHNVHLFINGDEVRSWQFEAGDLDDNTIPLVTRTANSLFEDRFASDGK